MASTTSGRTRSSRRQGERRPSLTFQNEEDGTEIIVQTADELIEWIRAEPETAWRIVTKRQTDIEEQQATIENLRIEHADEVMRMKEEITRLREQTPASHDLQIEEEYARMREELNETRRERDGLVIAMRLVQSAPARESPALPTFPTSRKSTKMPDPPMLSDGKDVKFKGWKTEMRRKLLLNEDHYPTAAHQLAYVSSRCEGKAQRHINPRMQDDAIAQYKTVQDVFDHLEGVFHDPNQKQVARDEYLALKMEPKQDFTDFLAEFTYFAEESEQPEGLRKRDLYRKLPLLLQNQVMIDAGDESTTLDQFIRKCQIASRLIAQQVANRVGNRGRSGANANANAPTSKTGGQEAQAQKDPTRNDPAKKASLMKEGRCFICEEQGHISRNCPKKRTSNAVVAAASSDVRRDKKVDLVVLEESDSDNSGKD